MKLYLTIFLAICMAVFCTAYDCPPPELIDLIKPCVCEDNNIICGGDSNIDLVRIFQTLDRYSGKSGKHFKSFKLNNTAITELKDNTFNGITFDEIEIEACQNLVKIHSNAFAGTDQVTKIIQMLDNPRLSSPDNSIFDTVSKFNNIEAIQLQNNNITEIPANAFKTILPKLVNIYIGGNSIRKIGNNAFSKLPSLKNLDISYTTIETVPEYAFNFDQISNEQLRLRVCSKSFIYSGYHQNSLIYFKRPVAFNPSCSNEPINLDYFDELIFLQFLNINSNNKLNLFFQSIDCTNCKNFWIKYYTGLQRRIESLRCSNDKNLNDPNNFLNCNLTFIEKKLNFEISNASKNSDPKHRNIHRDIDDVLYPCTLERDEYSIYCCGNALLDLKGILSNFSDRFVFKKHFTKFYLNNTSIKVLEENTFNDLTFDEIVVENCVNLKTIHRNAFTATHLVTKKLSINSKFQVTLFG